MTGTARRARAVRGHLARLAVAVAVLAGLAIGLQCTDAMAMPMTPEAHPAAATDCGSPTDTGQPTATCGATGATAALADGDAPGSGDLGGLLAACLAFLVAVLSAGAALRPGALRSVGRLLRSTRAVMIPASRPLAPSLAELCLLRT